ncbi:P-loop containing nucleoside triphosphate hydrolase protein [Polyporus arcularius HHB13444]|uniref:P-loop containing nucleoside triphosphate hydrolase protein n=1 Tax=Polyporus arcularius HHB13444 TaxID=1314778 RepID=A0A5C3PWG8_9APHY|nr:P-loop containing nucleoside triphosphate hydrolase protein [Polyporus arcularius HHB13444]
MTRPFFRQFGALFVKNWIVLGKRPLVNVVGCLLSPIALAVFLAYAQVFLSRPSKNGLGSMVPVASLADTYDPDLTLLWSDDTNGTGAISPSDIVSRMIRGFSGKQLASFRKVNTDDIATLCRENFSGSSACFASVIFHGIPGAGSNQTLNYTIQADSALGFVNVIDHTSDYERRILPLQWAIESAIIELDTGVTVAAPLEWPYTQSTNDDEINGIRLAYISFAAQLLVIAFFACFIGVSYQLPGMAVSERASGMTSQMKAMGLLDSARVLSWHLSLSLAYLPAWLVIAGIWQVKLFTGTSAGMLIAINILTGLSLTSWSMFVMAPFGKSPQLAAVASTILALVWCVIGMVWSRIATSVASILILFFPPIFFPIAIRCVVGFEITLTPTSATVADPEYFITLWPLFLAAIISIFVWPLLGALWERWLYDARNPSDGGCCGRRKKREDAHVLPADVAISMRNLGKDFRTSIFKGKKGVVTAISDLSLDIPKYGIFVLLGPNGAGKSTVMSILGGLTGRTRGTVMFEGGVSQPPRGSIGLVPQKNVLFPELTCYQTLRLFKTIKPQLDDAAVDEDIVQLLRDCDLANKVHYNAAALSGGQKRKLQLAIGLVGGSKIVLVDECTSGVDPLSRRSIWKTLTAVRNDRTIVFTTHFLDEADLLADEIAVLAAPGKLVAHGNPVTLKSTLGDGYTMKVTYHVSDEKGSMHDSTALLNVVRRIAPQTHVSVAGPDELAYHLKTHEPAVVRQVLEAVEREKIALGIASYSVSATSIEDIFLELMQEAEQKQTDSDAEKDGDPTSAPETPELPVLAPATIELTSGTQRSVLGQALTIFHKRILIARRSWLSYVLAMGVLLVAACVPLKFVPRDQEACQVTATQFFDAPLFLPLSTLGFFFRTSTSDYLPIVSPPDLLSALGNSTSTVTVRTLPDNASFIDEIDQHFLRDLYGGLSVDLQSGSALFAWNAEFKASGPIYLNTISNLLYNKALNDTGKAIGSSKLITPNLGNFPTISAGNLKPLEWAAFFGAAAVFPAFFTLYVAQERRSSVQAMQFSNGLSNPAGLWLGHLLFDSIFGIVCATIMTIVFAAKSTLFQGLGYLWFIMVLYSYTGILFAYLVSVWIKSPLAAFAVTAAYQIIIFGLYLAAYMLSLTYSKAIQSGRNINIIHFTMSLLSPALSVVRASFVSVNLFSLLCEGSAHVPTSSLGSITRFGGPILYLILYGLVLFGILVYVDSGSVWKQKVLARARRRDAPANTDARLSHQRADVLAEADAVDESQNALRVLNVSKSFGRAGKVVDSVTFGVAQDTIFALLGPNGAGKTTVFNMIRGDILPDAGEILINGRSIVRHTQQARLSLGVCPQFTAIDAQLTVREHLHVYARLKGLQKGAETQQNVHTIMLATGLDIYADRLASKLSGGNKRKLALAIALIGNPSVILIDEFSTGVDAKMKRDMWSTLKNIAHGKAIVITTHSMEEASTLANKVGIIAGRMLAVGPTDTLISRYARYLVHFPCRTREDVLRAQALMARIPGAKIADDVATRFEVPVGDGLSLAQLFGIIAEATAQEGGEGRSAGGGEWAVEEASLESVFMKVIRENEVEEGDGEARARRGWWRV